MQQALDHFGQTQRNLLRLLMQRPQGLAVDDIAQGLAITKNAVRQHLTALERDGFVGRGGVVPTGRRPEQLFVLSDRGRELFPRRYSFLADLMIDEVAEAAGPEALRELMAKMGKRIGESTHLGGPDATMAERVERLAQVMSSVGYEAHAEPKAPEGPEVVAYNCVFHHLAAKYPAVCDFDLAFMETATGAPVSHEECMLRGGNVCRFKLGKPPGRSG